MHFSRTEKTNYVYVVGASSQVSQLHLQSKLQNARFRCGSQCEDAKGLWDN